MGEITGLPETSVMKTGKSGDIMIDCPYCDFARPVAACLSTCEPKIVNWCPKIKTVPIEHLDAVAPKALRGKPHLESAWQERRDFFLAPVTEPRLSHEDDYDPDTHGGGGVVDADELELTQPDPDDDPSPETEIEPGPYADEAYSEADTPPDDDKSPAEEPEEPEDEPEDDPEPEESPEANTETQQEGTDVTASNDEGYDYKCPVKGCDGGGNSLRGLKIHVGRKHPDWEGELPTEPDKKPKKKTAKATSKKTSKKSKKKAGKKFQDTGRLIIVAGDKCHIIEDGTEDFSEDIGAIATEANEEVAIYKLGPQVRVRTVIEEV